MIICFNWNIWRPSIEGYDKNSTIASGKNEPSEFCKSGLPWLKSIVGFMFGYIVYFYFEWGTYLKVGIQNEAGIIAGSKTNIYSLNRINKCTLVGENIQAYPSNEAVCMWLSSIEIFSKLRSASQAEANCSLGSMMYGWNNTKILIRLRKSCDHFYMKRISCQQYGKVQ